MSQSIKKVMVIGAGGNLGKPILHALLDCSTFTVSTLSRQSSKSTFPSGLQVYKTDFSEASLLSAFKGQDAVVSVIGAGGFLEQKKIIDAAIKAGVKKFLPSEFSTNTLSDTVQQLVPVFNAKKDIVDYLKSKEDGAMTWTAIACGLLFDWGLKAGFLGYDLQSHSATIWDAGEKRFSLTNEATLGQAVVSVLQRPAETANKYLYIESVNTTQNEMLAELQRATGKTWDVKHTTTAAQVKSGQEAVAKGDFSGMFALVLATTYGELDGLKADLAEDEGFANELLGLPKESVRETVEAVVGH